ncbi:MAG: HEAT repeat domain-containing protein [Syntrophobacteraceae bacterium]
MIAVDDEPSLMANERDRVCRMLTIPESRPGALGEIIHAEHLRDVPVQAVAECLLDPAEATRILAIEALFSMGPKGVDGLTGSLFSSQPESVRISGAMALARLGAEASPASELLAACVQSEDPVLRLHAGLALSRIGPDAVPHLVPLLHSSNEEVARSAATALGRMGQHAIETREELRSVADQSPSPFVRIACLQAITSLQGDPAAGLLEAAPLLDHEDPEVRKACLVAIRETGSTDAAIREKVSAKLQDPVEMIRGAAALTLARVEPDAKAAVPALIALLSDDDLDVRGHAAMALAHYGPEASEALEPLTALKEVDAPWLLAVAEAALARIRRG